MDTFQIIMCLIPVAGIVGAIIIARLEESNQVRRDYD